MLRLLGSGAAGLLLAACGSQAAPSASPPSAATSPPATAKPSTAAATSSPGAGSAKPSAAPSGAVQPKSGGVLRMGVLGDLQGLDGHLTTGLDTTRRIWEPLTVLDAQLNVSSVLAESFDIKSDAKQLTLQLRKGVQWHTGRELTSDDVIWNFKRLQDPKTNPIYANLTKPFASLQAPDKYTVVVGFDNPDPFVGDALQALVMLDPVTFQQSGPLRPVGTGAFTFGDYTQGVSIRLLKNTNYWRSGLPYLDEIQVTIYKDPQALISAFEGGQLDVASGPPGPSVPDFVRLQKNSKYQALLDSASGNYQGVAFNCTQPPTNNKLFRQALNFALDRQRVADSVWQGLEKPLGLLWFPNAPAYDATQNQHYAFDLDRAKALLAQSGVTDASVDYNYGSTSQESAQIGQIWQADLAKIGVKMTIKPADPVALVVMEQRQTYQGIATSTGFYGQLHGGVVWTSPLFGPINNYSGFKDDKFTQLSLAAYTATDQASQKAANAAWNDFVTDSAHVTAITSQSPRALAQANVHSLAWDVAGAFLDVSNAWLA
ncbi:MAG: ABC transporter substrate-binding protein [Chloroflexi bacterium]|nr:ABC transporter substrate-binding protein [Chloroflexota bacterium]